MYIVCGFGDQLVPWAVLVLTLCLGELGLTTLLGCMGFSLTFELCNSVFGQCWG